MRPRYPSRHFFAVGDMVQRQSDGWTGIVVEHSALYAAVRWDGLHGETEEVAQHDRGYTNEGLASKATRAIAGDPEDYVPTPRPPARKTRIAA
jgi:hypothetical protein